MSQLIDILSTCPTFSVDESIKQVQEGNAIAASSLKKTVLSGLRWFFSRHSPAAEVEEQAAIVAGAVMDAVATGRVHSARELTAFTRSAAMNSIGDGSAASANTHAPRQNVKRMKQALSDLQPRERDAITRHYEGQPMERICSELGFSHAEFGILKQQLRSSYAQTEAPGVAGRLASFLRPYHA